MRLRKTALFILLAVAVLMTSCQEELGTTSLKLILKSDSASRLITNQSADIDHYKVVGTGPQDKEGEAQKIEVTVTAAESSTTLSGLLIGNWKFEVTAYNSNGTPLMSGLVNVNVTSRPSPVVIDVNTPVGSGNISLDISWSAPEVEDPQLKVYLRGPSMSSEESSTVNAVIGAVEGTATYQVSNLVSGTYVIRVELYDGDKLYGGKIESVKIFTDTTTTGSIAIVYDAEVTHNGTGLTLQTNYGRPVQGSISCPSNDSHTLYVLEETTLEFSVSSTEDIVDSDYTVEWYYDGVKQTQGTTALSSNKSTFTFKPYLGVHIVNVLCYNKNYGSVGTAEWSFSTVTRGEPGSLYKQREVSAGEGGIKTGSRILIGALDCGKFLVLSPDNTVIQACGLENNNLKVYSSFNAGWLANAEKVFSSPEMNAFAVTDSTRDSGSSQENLTLFMSSSCTSSASISVLKDQNTAIRRYRSADNEEDYPFVRIVDAGFKPDVSTKGGFIYFSDANTNEGNTVYFGFDESNITSTKTYASKQNYNAWLSSSFDIMGSKMIYTKPSSATICFEYLDNEGDPEPYSGNMSKYEINVSIIPTYVKAISDTCFAISDGYSKTCCYKLNNGIWMLESTLNHPSSKIIVSEDGYVYMLDSYDSQGHGDSTLYAYSRNNGTFTELNRVSAKLMTDIACSSDMVLACTSDGNLIFCKVVSE